MRAQILIEDNFGRVVLSMSIVVEKKRFKSFRLQCPLIVAGELIPIENDPTRVPFLCQRSELPHFVNAALVRKFDHLTELRQQSVAYGGCRLLHHKRSPPTIPLPGLLQSEASHHMARPNRNTGVGSNQ